ncbi:ATP-binding protein [Urechidicola sp. KH5]
MKNTILCWLIFCSAFLFAQEKNIILDSLYQHAKDAIDLKQYDTAKNAIDQLQRQDYSDFNKLEFDLLKAELLVAQDDDEGALTLLLEDTEVLENYKDRAVYSDYKETIGRIFTRAQNYSKAQTYFVECLQSAESRSDSISMASANLNLGSLYQMQSKMDSAAFYYDKVLKVYPENSKDVSTLATVYSNLTGIAVSRGQFQEGEDYALKSFEMYTQQKDTLKMAGVLSNLGSVKMYLQDYNASEKYYLQALDLLQNADSSKELQIKSMALYNVSQVDYLKGDFETGYNYLFESVDVEKMFHQKTLKNQVTEIEAKYNLAKEEKEIAIEKSKRQRAEFMSYLFASIIFALLVSFSLVYSRNKYKTQKQAFDFEMEKMRQIREMEQVQNESQIKILNATLDGKEAERKHIAEILHDNVSTLLSSANMHLYAIKTELKGNAPSEMPKIEAIIDEASDKIRDLSHKLISSVLLKFGLAAATEDLCEKYSNSYLMFNCESTNVVRYNQSYEIKIHNIIDELVNNIIKHSNATLARISIVDTHGNLNLKIQDNGDGFKMSEVASKDGLGLTQVKARIKMMNGSIKITSSKDNGTEIKMVIPIQPE